MDDRPAAFVLNMFATGLGIARNLGRMGIRVTGLSARYDAPGNFSRYCNSMIVPDTQEQSEGLLDILLTLGKRQATRGILFPTRDADVIFVDRYRSLLEPFFAIPQPRREVLNQVLDKSKLTQVAAIAGIDTPRTIRVSSVEELVDHLGVIDFPVVLKPVYAVHWRAVGVWQGVGARKGFKADSREELLAHYRRVATHQSDVLIQEWIEGDEDQHFVYGAYFDQHGSCVGEFAAQKLMQYPPLFGLGCAVRTVENSDVVWLGRRLLEAITFSGIAEVEFKRDRRTGAYRLIEINPRHWDQHTLGTTCGINISHLAYLDLCQQRKFELAQRQQGKGIWLSWGGIVRCLKEELGDGRFYWHKWKPLIAASRTVHPVWDWGDQGPFWRSVLNRVRRRV